MQYQTPSKARHSVTISCPKCASNEGKSVEDIYCECRTPHEPRQSSIDEMLKESLPPEPQHTSLWMIVTVLSGILCASSSAFQDATPVAFGACTLLSATMTHQAFRYNRNDFPLLLDHWHKSYMCTRCGEVYVPT
jgi:hypothetical protein